MTLLHFTMPCRAFLSWGGVVLGIGLCLLLVCLMLCIHAYCVVANASRAEDVVSYASPVSSTIIMSKIDYVVIHFFLFCVQTFPRSGVGEKVLNSKDHKENSNTLPRHSKNRPSAVRFNLVEDSSLRHSCQIERNRHPTVQKLALNPTFDIKKSIQKSSQSTFQTDTMNLTPSFPNSIVVESEDDRQEHKKSLHDHSMNKLYNISTQKLLSENLQNMPMTRNFGVSKITVTPIYHNHYEYKTCDARPSRMDVPPSRLHAIQQGHIVTGNRPEFNPLFPDCSSKLENPAINESELRRFPLLEVGDSKATVYDNVQYYCM